MASVTQGAYAFAGSLCDRFDAIEARIKALELGKEQNDILEMLREFAPDMVAPDFRQKFTQADLDVAVEAAEERGKRAERARCANIVQDGSTVHFWIKDGRMWAERSSLVRAIEAGD